MGHSRKFRFGVQFVNATGADDWRRKVQEAETLGYDAVCLSDHFGDQLAPLTALMQAADATRNVRVGAGVFDNDFRHPVVLGKELATLDLLSGGRLELGIGAGWMKKDYDESGIPYDTPRIRLDRFEEAVAVLKGLFSSSPLNFEGRYYQVKMEGRPRCVQRPHPPFFIGGGGRRMLGIAAREADIVGINFNLAAGEYGPGLGADASVESTQRKLGWVREAAGARYADLELNVLAFVVVVTPAREQVAKAVGPHFNLSGEGVLAMPYALIGSLDEIVATLEERRAMWDISYVTVGESSMHAFAPVVARLAGR